jgi:hypothetical protein
LDDAENTVYVGRPTKWGDPFKATRVVSLVLDHTELPDGSLLSTPRPGERETVAGAVNAYETELIGEVEMEGLRFDELSGKNFACWCQIGQPCHADVLLSLSIETA